MRGRTGTGTGSVRRVREETSEEARWAQRREDAAAAGRGREERERNRKRRRRRKERKNEDIVLVIGEDAPE